MKIVTLKLNDKSVEKYWFGYDDLGKTLPDSHTAFSLEAIALAAAKELYSPACGKTFEIVATVGGVEVGKFTMWAKQDINFEVVQKHH